MYREMGHVGGTLFTSGALLVGVDLLTFSGDYTARGWVVAVMVAALAAGLFYFWSAERLPLPVWAFAVGTSVGAVLVTVLVVAGGPARTATFGVLYVFVSTYGFYYYGPAISWWLVGLNGIGFGFALAYHDVPGATSQWCMIVGTAAIAGGLSGSLSQRVRDLLAAEQATVEQLHERDGWKTTFLQAVAHDLRSPLVAVIGLVRTVHDHPDALTQEQQQTLLARATASGERLEQLIDDLLDVERIAAGVVTPDRRPTRLDDLVTDTLDGLELGDRQVELDLAPVVAAVEPAKIERVVTNLVHNAVRHTDEDTTVWVRVREVGPDAVVTVEDNGRGVAEQARSDLFEAFRRDGTSIGRSVGLGLHLVRRFTELHGGEVAVDDRPGGGARFTVRLPMAADDPD